MFQFVLFSFLLSAQTGPPALGQNGQMQEEALQFAEVISQGNPGIHFERYPSAQGRSLGQFTGKVYRLEDLQLIQEVIKRSRGQIVDNTEFSESLKKELRRQLEAELRRFQSPGKLLFRKKKIYLNNEKRPQVLQALRLIYPGVQISKSSWNKPERIRPSLFLEIAFVEIKKDALKRLGLRFGQSLDFGLSIHPRLIHSPSDLINISGINPIASFLDIALAQGQARIHFKQSLVTEDGEETYFRSGGEYSYRVKSTYSAGIGKIPYGIRLRFIPRLLHHNKVHLKIDAQIREPDMENAIGDFPPIDEKSLKTQLSVSLGETMAIAGILKSSQGKTITRLPGLGEIPILGSFFSSKSFRDNRSEAYIFITPRKLKAAWQPEWKEN